jgi:hypothetical protein
MAARRFTGALTELGKTYSTLSAFATDDNLSYKLVPR